MYSADIYNTNKEKVSQVVLDEKVFGCEVKPHLLYEVVKMQLANRRAGTASTKNRSHVRGGGKKPWRQKGTGRARAGSIRSPIWKGGGTTFGPLPRDYSYRLNKKVKKLALRTALSIKLKEDKLLILDNFNLPEIKTKGVITTLNRFDIKDAFIIDDSNLHLEKSASNVPFVKVLRPEGLNVYDILRYDKLIITQSCLEKITRTLSA
ncbi:MAG: 50S ribosomal protein L4 [Deltaproteobacteria bacterium]|jgi:large subunit ribosomal protein L4|nr:50S ribosomal protein L4 [Deltaproteobacteria bacterium]MBW2554427.1 50S ribosomal protein L4 [Deltaproteobacteria bacterium]MBW2651455.1 50S ribosomal protein L4 [Deltaproteobacteria bacterium]NOQ85657.1 50S ribosomal protein L4 [Deltaproteobacteria bacterium]